MSIKSFISSNLSAITATTTAATSTVASATNVAQDYFHEVAHRRAETLEHRLNAYKANAAEESITATINAENRITNAIVAQQTMASDPSKAEALASAKSLLQAAMAK